MAPPLLTGSTADKSPLSLYISLPSKRIFRPKTPKKTATMKKNSLPFILLPLLFLTAHSVNFTCNQSPAATCQALAGYVAVNATTLSQIQALFQLHSLLPLLSANNLGLSTPASSPVPAGSTVRVPFTCTCSGGTGRSDHTPVYTVRPDDTGMDYIARTVFEQFVTYQEIAEANGIKNVNVITPGEKLWIPLPCSCDRVGSEEVVHLGHVVAKGSSVAAIAAEFGADDQVIMRLNGLTDPKELLAGQVLDVPLKACSSSISSTALDNNLRVPNGSYALTAENCIQCSCSSNYQLSCKPIESLNKTTCPVAKCGDQQHIGDSTTKGCNITTCSYEGYTKSNGLSIMAGLTSNSTCNNAPPPGSNSAVARLRIQGCDQIVGVLFLLQFAMFWFSY